MCARRSFPHSVPARLSITLLYIVLRGACSSDAQEAEALPLDFKILIRPSQPFLAVGEPARIEVACIGVPRISSQERLARWDDTCSKVTLDIQAARIAGIWGYPEPMPWLPNRLHRCLSPAGESHEKEAGWVYSKPKWHLITIPPEQISGMRGMVTLTIHSVLNENGEKTYEESAQLITGIMPREDYETKDGLGLDFRRDVGAVECVDAKTCDRLADEFLESPTLMALRRAVRVFDNTQRTASLWRVIESSPFQQRALDLMGARLKESDFVPSYELLQGLIGMKARLDQPLEFDASVRTPYEESHPDLERAAVKYFRYLLELAVNSTEDPRSARASSLAEMVASISKGSKCPLGTYGLSLGQAASLNAKLLAK